ncbi:MAG: hypothetical protein PHD41_00055 [Methanosarcinaceae archaeon]|nr:hypothetical protein [Methanosarcinaceae archaeon]MDD4331503.1 hypothetical protein [Methanosarcinaceae archaeon]MDD4748386.1 hypothetical protein [Methanosarcinaceae archaeon]
MDEESEDPADSYSLFKKYCLKTIHVSLAIFQFSFFIFMIIMFAESSPETGLLFMVLAYASAYIYYKIDKKYHVENFST